MSTGQESRPQTFDEWCLTRPQGDRLTAQGWNLAELAWHAGVASQQAELIRIATERDDWMRKAFEKLYDTRHEAVIEAARKHVSRPHSEHCDALRYKFGDPLPDDDARCDCGLTALRTALHEMDEQ